MVVGELGGPVVIVDPIVGVQPAVRRGEGRRRLESTSNKVAEEVEKNKNKGERIRCKLV